MKQKYRRGIDVVDKHLCQRKYMSLGLLLITLTVLLAVPGALAVGNFPPLFNLEYNTTGTRIDASSCIICHAGVPALNDYGNDLNQAGVNSSSTDTELINGLTAIEQLDSDGDGFSNIVEINERFFPGNSLDHPATTPTATPTATPTPPVNETILTSLSVTTTPLIDGISEPIWDQAIPLMVNISGGANAGSHNVILKSIYTDDSVYFLVKWNDPTESLRRMPWQKQADGTWKQLKTPDAKEGGEQTYYEDKFSQIWNLNITGFEVSGCSVLCHAGENSDVKAYGNKYTANTGEMGDIWHMKIVRTNTTGFVDDQYIDSTGYSNATPDAGRHSDPGLVPYYDNINANKTAPNFTSADQPAPPYWIFDDEKQPFNDTYSVDDEIAGIIVRPPTGDRADIRGKAVYMDGNWTLEYGRKLITGSQFDIQFSDLKQQYLFGTAVFDNAQTRHSYENGVSKFVFAASANVTDIIPPVTTISGVTENGSYNNSVNVTLNATDNPGGSGVNETFYMVNGGPTTTYSAPFVVDTIGPDNITYWSTDNTGNVESQNMVNFTIVNVSIEDAVPPVTTTTIIENGSYNNSVNVTLNATDNPGGSGVNETFYMVNGGPTTTYSAPFVVDTIGPDNVTYWSTDNAGNVEPQNIVNFTIVEIPEANATAIRTIENKSILPGESTIITVNIAGTANALALHEIPPEGWNVTRGTDNADVFKNSTIEWVWKNTGDNKTVTYTMTAPSNISIGTYNIEGTIIDAKGTLIEVAGDNSVKIDILEYYRRLGDDPGVIETMDLLRAFDDFRNNIVPQGFDRPLSAAEVDDLVNEWINS